MIDPNQVGAAPKPLQEDAQAANTGNPTVEQQASQQQYFDSFNQIEGLSSTDKLELLNAKGFDPQSNYTLVMDDYNRRREEELKQMEELKKRQADLEAANEDLKKKDSSLESSGGGFESGGGNLEGDSPVSVASPVASPAAPPEATADPYHFGRQQADEALVNSYMAGQEAAKLREAARYEEDIEKRNEIMAEARRLSAEAHVATKKAAENLNKEYEGSGSNFRLNPESSVDLDFMFQSMAQRAKEDDDAVRKDFGYLGIDNRAELEEYKELGGLDTGISGGYTLEELREKEWDSSYGLERLFDNAYTTFGSGALSAAAGAADMIGGVFGVDSDDNTIAKYWRDDNKRLQARNQRSRMKGMEEIGISDDYKHLGTLETFGMAISGDENALKKFVSVDLPDAFGMVAGEALVFMGTRGAGKAAGAKTGLSKLLPQYGKMGEAMSIGQSMGMGAAQSLAPTLLSYIPRGYESYREEHPEASMAQSAFFGTLSGIAEGMMSAVMLGAGRGTQAAISRTFTRDSVKASVKKQVREALGKKGGSPFLGDIAGEGLEEGFVAYTEQLINMAGDVVNGKDPREINMHAVLDGAFVGMLGGSGPATLSAAASGLSHSSNLRDAQAQAAVVTRLRKEYETEKDPKKKAAKRTAYASSLKKYEMIKKKDQEMYETLQDQEVDELMNIHQEIANISSTVKKGSYFDGSQLTKEDRAQMKSRLETLFERKANIENAAEARAFKESIPDNIVVPDVQGRPAKASTRTLDASEVKQHKALPEAKEAAPADVAQEEGQLMLFDENTMDDMVQRPGEPESTRSPEPTTPAQAPTSPSADQPGTTPSQTATSPSEAEATQAPPKAESAPESEAAPVQEDAQEIDLASGKPIDIGDSSIVGDGAGQISIQNASQINRLIKGFGKAFKKTGAKLKAHRTMDSFYAINERVKNMKGYIEIRSKETGQEGWVAGFYDPTTQTVHLNPMSDTMDVMEEVGHLVLRDVIGKDAESREALYNEFKKLTKGKSKGAKRLKQIFDQNLENYATESEATKQEEGIINVLVEYARDPKQFTTVADRIRAAINKVMKKAGFESNIITGKEGLFELADKFKRAADGDFIDVEVAKSNQKAQQAPAEQAPAQEEVTQETPAEVAPVAEEATVQEAPAEQAPAEQAPVEEAPVEEAPADQAPVEQAPVAEEVPAAEEATQEVSEKDAQKERDLDVKARLRIREAADATGTVDVEQRHNAEARKAREKNPELYERHDQRTLDAIEKIRPYLDNLKKALSGLDGGEQGKDGKMYARIREAVNRRIGLAKAKKNPSTLRDMLLENEARMKRGTLQADSAFDFDQSLFFKWLSTFPLDMLVPEGEDKGKIMQGEFTDSTFQQHFHILLHKMGAQELANELDERMSNGSMTPSGLMRFIGQEMTAWYDSKRPEVATSDAIDKVRRDGNLTQDQKRARIDNILRDMKKDKTMSDPEINKALEAQADALLEGTEGISTLDGDALADAVSLDSFQGRMSVRRKQEFNYLKDTEIFYEFRPYIQADETPTVSSRYSTFTVTRSIKVNDYFHFRNWFNKTTGNQSADRVGRMYYIKDGKKYMVKPPKPRVDKDGKPVRMPVPPSPRDRQRMAQIEASKNRKGVLQQVKELNDGNRKLFAQLPWKGLVNAGQFRPATKPVSEMSPNDSYVASLIERKNIEAALEMGLTKEQVQQRLESQGRDLVVGLNRAQDGDLVNATGLSPFEESVDGQPVGMFAVRTKPQIQEAGGVFKRMSDSTRSFFGVTEEGNLDELKGVFGIIMGYDRTGKRRKGITSGIKALLGMQDDVLSTHVDSRTARKIQERFFAKAVAIWEASGKTKTKGEFFVGFSTLNPEATLGNPDVFEAMYDTLLDMVKSGEISPREFVDGFNATAMPSLLLALDRHSDASNGASASLISDLLYKDGNKYKFDNDVEITEAHVELIVDALKKQHKNFKDSFSSRKKFFSDAHANKFLDKVGAPKKSKKEDRVAAHFNDTELDGVESATLTAYKKFEYELEFGSDGKPRRLKGFKVDADPKLGFAGILRTPKSSPMKHMKDLFRLEDIDPDYKFKSEDSKQDIEDAQRSPRERALQANQYSLFEFNSDLQDIDMTQLDENGEAKDDGGRPSIRTGTRRAQTTNGTWAMREMSGFQRWRNKWLRRLQDKYIDIFNLQDTIEAARGRRAADQDFRMAEELMYGKAAEDLNKLDQKVDKITELMKEKGFTVEDVSDYLYALHAMERNDLIFERTDGKVKDGSGMSNGKAQEILNRYESQKAEMKEIVDLVREIQQDTRDTMVKFGLETQETIDAFEAQFDNYVPLSGIAIDEETSFTSSYPTGGAGFSVFGSSTKRAEGRKSEATNILAQIIAQNSSIHIKARTNESLQALYNLVENNPNEDVWQILDGSKVNAQDPHIVSVRVNGEQKFIRFKDASYAETLRNMNLPQTSVFVRLLRAPANWLRKSFTTLNPEFMISNFSRDIQAAMFNAAAEADIPGGIVEGKGIVAEMLKNVPTTLKTLLRSESPKNLKKMFAENPEFERYYEDFKADGGKTGWSYARPLDQIAKDLQSKSSEKSRMQDLMGKAENFAAVVEGYNDAFENSIRLSAYIAARKQGVSREKAAQMAKNITVNFNKSGEYGQLLNSVYLFFNASVQGTARLGKSLLTMKEPTRPDGSKVEWYNRFNNAQKMAAALTVFSGMAAMMALAMSDEDEDGELYYNKIPDYIKERNIIIMRPNGRDYFKIPLPYGFSMFANLGTTAVEVGYGHKQVDTAMMQLASSFMNSFSPISFGQSKDLYTKAGKSMVPTVFKPLVDVMTNETYFGGPVYSENLPFGVQKPESSMSFRSPEMVQQFFRWMNEATGGSVEVKGDLDFNPDKMWYMFEYFIGGAGKFVTRSGQAARKLAAKAEDNDLRIEANDIPFARILYGEPSKYMDKEDYARRKTEIQSLYKEVRNNPRKDKPQRYKGVAQLNESLKSYEKMLQSIRRAKRAALNIEDYTERMKRIQELRDKERKVVMQFNKQYEKLRGKDK